MKIFRVMTVLILMCSSAHSAHVSDFKSPDVHNALTDLDTGIKQLEARDPQARNTIATAAALLEQATMESSNQTPSVFHALGNAYVLIEEYGPATLAYRRGHQIDPRDPRLIDSLSLVRSQVQTQVEPSVPNRIRAALVSWRGYIPRTGLWWSFIGLFTMGWCVLILRTIPTSIVVPKALGLWCIAGSALPLATLIYEWSFEHAQVGVVITSDATRAMSGPDDSIYDPVYNEPLSGGVEGILEETRDGWARIRLLDNTECWIPVGTYTKIKIDS